LSISRGLNGGDVQLAMAGGIPLHPAKKKVLNICSELAILTVINLFEDV
jgi:hypothetical protein